MFCPLESGFWVVATSDDEISELKSYESNRSEIDSDAEKSDNDYEVMEILGQIEDHPNVIQTNKPEDDLERSDNESVEMVCKQLSSYLFPVNTSILRLPRIIYRYHHQLMKLP